MGSSETTSVVNLTAEIITSRLGLSFVEKKMTYILSDCVEWPDCSVAEIQVKDGSYFRIVHHEESHGNRYVNVDIGYADERYATAQGWRLSAYGISGLLPHDLEYIVQWLIDHPFGSLMISGTRYDYLHLIRKFIVPGNLDSLGKLIILEWQKVEFLDEQRHFTYPRRERSKLADFGNQIIRALKLPPKDVRAYWKRIERQIEAAKRLSE